MLKLQYFDYLMWRANSMEKTLMLGKVRAEGEEGNREWDVWMASLTQWTCVLNKLWDSEGQGSLVCCSHGVAKSQTWLKRLTCSHVWMWELHHKEGWAPKTCFQIVVLEKTLESPLDCKEIQPVNPKGNQSWIFIGRTDAEAPVLWLPDAKSQLFGKDPDAGKNWRQKEKWAAENKMVGWHHRLNRHVFE